MTHTFRKTAVLAALASAMLGAAGTAAAQQGFQARSPSSDLGFYTGIGVGSSRFDGVCNGASSCDDKDSTWKLFGGYNFNNNLGLELGYHDLGSFSASAPGFSGNGDVTGWEVSGVGRMPLGQSGFSLFGKVGGFRWDRSIGRTGPAFGGAGSNTGTDWTWGLGAQYAFNRNLSARLEWQQFRDVGTGGSDVNAVTANAVYKF